MKKSLSWTLLFLAMVLVSVLPAAAQDTIKIGMYADLSAGSAQWGNDALKGAKLMVKEVNAAGGVMGKKIELIAYDCKMSPTEGVKVYSRLAKEDKVSAVYGSLISNIGLAVSPVAEQIKIPVVSRAMDERVTTPDFKMEDPETRAASIPTASFFSPQAISSPT